MDRQMEVSQVMDQMEVQDTLEGALLILQEEEQGTTLKEADEGAQVEGRLVAQVEVPGVVQAAHLDGQEAVQGVLAEDRTDFLEAPVERQALRVRMSVCLPCSKPLGMCNDSRSSISDNAEMVIERHGSRSRGIFRRLRLRVRLGFSTSLTPSSQCLRRRTLRVPKIGRSLWMTRLMGKQSPGGTTSS